MKLLKSSTDPLTGEVVSPTERVSRFAQAMIRRWTFIGIITVVTAFWWTHPGLFNDPNLVHWNLGASYMALLIESVVGIGMYHQQNRDAIVLRKTLQLEVRVLQILEHVEALTEVRNA
jgi:hypothetical protein